LDKTVEINYGGTVTVKGRLIDIVDGVAKLQAQDQTIFYVPIDKIHVFWEVLEKEKAVGFVTKPSHKE
jgi:hypothetical protein